MLPARALTEKGERSAARMLKAATTVLARDGYGGATLGRIAEEAGVDKRGILYYYGTREALLIRVVQTVGEQIALHVESAPLVADTPEELAEDVISAMWAGVTSLEELSRAYFALIGGGAGAPEVEQALQQLKDAYLQAITHRLTAIHARWRIESVNATAAFVLATLRGLLLEWIEAGDSAELEASIARLKRVVAAEYGLQSQAAVERVES